MAQAGAIRAPLEGTVDGTGFRIHRIITYRNSFRPQLHGRIEPTPSGGARVVISLQLHPVVLVLLALGVSFFATFWPFGPPSASGPDPRLMLAGISAFVVFLVLVGFIPEAHKAEQLLKDIVEAREAAGGTAAA